MNNNYKIIMKEVNKSSQIFNLIQQMVNESPIDSLQRDMKHLRDLRDSVSAFPYETYQTDARNVHEMVKKNKK